MSARLHASRALRRVALSVDTELTRSSALLAELAMLVRAHYARRIDDVLDDEGEVIVPAGDLERIGAQEIRAWWLEHRAGLVEMHREIAEAQLGAIGVAA